MATTTRQERIAELQREIRMRHQVYPRWVKENYDLNQATADFRIACLVDVLEEQLRLQDAETGQQSLFAAQEEA